MLKIIDVHTHLESQFFGDHRDEVLKRALDNEIFIINVGVNKKSSQEVIEIANKNSFGVWATVGQHPTENKKFDYDFYKKLALEKKVVAIGECGLDYFRLQSANRELKIEKQKEIFIQHIKLAKEIKKPLMIHCRDAFNDLIKILRTTNYVLQTNNIIHFFTGTIDDAKKLLEMGFYFTFGGLITFNRDFDEIIKFLPLDKILLETDAPFVAPIPYRGQKNEPAYIVEIAKKMAEIKNISFEEICKQTTENAKVVFGLNFHIMC